MFVCTSIYIAALTEVCIQAREQVVEAGRREGDRGQRSSVPILEEKDISGFSVGKVGRRAYESGSVSRYSFKGIGAYEETLWSGVAAGGSMIAAGLQSICFFS